MIWICENRFGLMCGLSWWMTKTCWRIQSPFFSFLFLLFVLVFSKLPSFFFTWQLLKTIAPQHKEHLLHQSRNLAHMTLLSPLSMSEWWCRGFKTQKVHCNLPTKKNYEFEILLTTYMIQTRNSQSSRIWNLCISNSNPNSKYNTRFPM